MTDRAQFEAMLEALINEDHDQAKEIFHQIVVGKSREIYEELLAEDFDADTMNKGVNGSHKSEMEEDEMEEDEMEEDDTEEEEGAEDDAEDDAESDDAEDDSEDNPFGGEDDAEDDGEEPEGDIEDRVMDLEDALEDLKAEFEQLLQGEEHEEENEPGIHGAGNPMHDIEADMGGMDEPEDESVMHHVHHVMEYVNKVPAPKHGDNGQYTKSPVASKNDMGGTTANIAKNFSTTSGGTQGGLLAPSAKEENFGNVNVPGGKAGKTGFKKQEPGHGAEKKGKGEAGVDKKSLIGGRVR